MKKTQYLRPSTEVLTGGLFEDCCTWPGSVPVSDENVDILAAPEVNALDFDRDNYVDYHVDAWEQ